MDFDSRQRRHYQNWREQHTQDLKECVGKLQSLLELYQVELPHEANFEERLYWLLYTSTTHYGRV